MAIPWRQPGDTIEAIFLVGDLPFIVFPATVVTDSADRISHFLAAGTQYKRRRLLDGSPVPRVATLDDLEVHGSRLATATWRSNNLVVTDPVSAHGVRLKWHPATWAFEGWYVNLQEPLTRTATGFTTADHFLDIVVGADSAWQWKDEDELELAVERERITPAQADAIRAEGERVIVDIEARRFPFDDSLIGWRPDPSWSIPMLRETSE